MELSFRITRGPPTSFGPVLFLRPLFFDPFRGLSQPLFFNPFAAAAGCGLKAVDKAVSCSLRR